MSLIFVHLRWNDVDAEQCAQVLRTVPREEELPAGCLARELHREGNGLAATETWDDAEAGGRMDQLVAAVRAAGVGRSPQIAMFSVPAIFAVAYRRPPAGVPTGQLPAGIPAQRTAEPEGAPEVLAARAGG